MLTVPFWLQQKNSHVTYRHYPLVYGRELMKTTSWLNGPEKIPNLDEFAAYEIIEATYPNGASYVQDYAYVCQLTEEDYKK